METPTMFTVWFLYIVFTGPPSYSNVTYSATVIDNIASQQECEALKKRLYPDGNNRANCNYVVKIK